LCTAAGDQVSHQTLSDGAGGAIVAWQDHRSGTDFDIYVQHVTVAGALDPTWPLDGLGLCTVANNQMSVQIVPDGAGGAIVAWEDWRSDTSAYIYTQHVTAAGAIDPTWPTDGLAVCPAGYHQTFPRVVSDGAGGAIVT
jgi:hypothetical protein